MFFFSKKRQFLGNCARDIDTGKGRGRRGDGWREIRVMIQEGLFPSPPSSFTCECPSPFLFSDPSQPKKGGVAAKAKLGGAPFFSVRSRGVVAFKYMPNCGILKQENISIVADFRGGTRGQNYSLVFVV